MRRRSKSKYPLIAMILALMVFLTWQFSPLQAVFAIANLSDPAKLATLGERGANPRLNKIVYWLAEARSAWLKPETSVRAAQLINGTVEPHSTLVRESLVRNVKIADELGLFTAENKEKLKRGQAAIVTRGPYQGEPVEIDHIVPISLAPELGNELANLEMLPKTLNRRKSNRISQRQVEFAERFLAAQLITQDSCNRVKAKFRP